MNKNLVLLVVLAFMVVGCKDKIVAPVMSSQEMYVSEHPELSDEMKKTILDETVAIGMTEAEVIASWGRPDDIQVFSSEYNSYKRWIYKNRPKVYWNDGKVSQLLK